MYLLKVLMDLTINRFYFGNTNVVEFITVPRMFLIVNKAVINYLMPNYNLK